ncbi:hypothetical protein P4S52_08295 [Vibrio sp. SA48]
MYISKFLIALAFTSNIVSAERLNIAETGILKFYYSCEEKADQLCVKSIDSTVDNRVLVTFSFDSRNTNLSYEEGQWVGFVRNQMFILLSTLNPEAEKMYSEEHRVYDLTLGRLEQSSVVLGMEAHINDKDYAGFSMYFYDNEIKARETLIPTNMRALEYYNKSQGAFNSNK